MNPKTLKIAYWVATIAFAAWLIGDGIAGVMHTATGVEVFVRIGMPLYVMTIVGIAKILAGLAILQTKFRTLKEWAFAGYAIDCLGASASHFSAHDSIGWILLPFVFLAIMFIPYWLWKKTS